MCFIYDNFAGTSLNTSKWVSFNYYGTITVNNGITISVSNPNSIYYIADAGIFTSIGFNPSNTIADIYITNASGSYPVININTNNYLFLCRLFRIMVWY